MQRQCSRCRRSFTPKDLCKDASRSVEAQRKAAGLEGFAFRCYTCADCGTEDLFVDVFPLDGESEDDLHRRTHELEALIGDIPTGDADVVVVERTGHPPAAH